MTQYVAAAMQPKLCITRLESLKASKWRVHPCGPQTRRRFLWAILMVPQNSVGKPNLWVKRADTGKILWYYRADSLLLQMLLWNGAVGVWHDFDSSYAGLAPEAQ